MDDKKLAGKEIGGFVVHPSWSRRGRSVAVSLSLSHKGVGRTHPSLPAKDVKVSLQSEGGEEWPCMEAPEGELVAITGPGTLSLAVFVFEEPRPGAMPGRLTVSVRGSQASFALEES